MSKVKKTPKNRFKSQKPGHGISYKKKDMIKGFVFSEQLPQRGGTFVKIRHWPL